jgi:hypothetical protein
MDMLILEERGTRNQAMRLRHIAVDDRSNGSHAAPHGLSLRSRANNLWPLIARQS